MDIFHFQFTHDLRHYDAFGKQHDANPVLSHFKKISQCSCITKADNVAFST